MRRSHQRGQQQACQTKASAHRERAGGLFDKLEAGDRVVVSGGQLRVLIDSGQEELGPSPVVLSHLLMESLIAWRPSACDFIQRFLHHDGRREESETIDELLLFSQLTLKSLFDGDGTPFALLLDIDERQAQIIYVRPAAFTSKLPRSQQEQIAAGLEAVCLDSES